MSFSSSGGAGLVARALAESQLELGHDARLISFYTRNLHAEPLKSPLLTVSAFADKSFIKSPTSSSMVNLLRSKFNLLDPAMLRSDSIINLHWVEGVIGHREIAQLVSRGRKVVWTLHDMAPFTSICHYSESCSGYKSACKNCPAARTKFQKTVEKNHENKIKFRSDLAPVRLVVPSDWMAKAAAESSIFLGAKVAVIENPVNDAYFVEYSKSEARHNLGVAQDELICATLATRLDNPIKQVDKLVEKFFHAVDYFKIQAKLMMFGAGGEKLASKYPGRILLLGDLSPEDVPQKLVAADILASFSLAESAGMTIREAGALGIPSISLSNQGADSLITNMEDGFLLKDINDLHGLMEKILNGEINLRKVGAKAKLAAALKSKSNLVARNYLRLYEELY